MNGRSLHISDHHDSGWKGRDGPAAAPASADESEHADWHPFTSEELEKQPEQ